jgi:hypothetical protein
MQLLNTTCVPTELEEVIRMFPLAPRFSGPSFQRSSHGALRRNVKRVAVLSLLLVLVLALAACGGLSYSSTVSTTSVSIDISPISLSVPVGRSAPLTATVRSVNQVVTWQVNGVTGGDAIHGQITTGGIYTAPAAIPSPATVTVTAIAQADSKAKAQVMVTVTASSSSPVSVSPSATTLGAGSTLAFAANVNGTPSTAVNWQVNGVTGGDSVHGTITSSGVYTAPLTPPPTGTTTITAVAQGGAGSGDSAATVAFSDASLHGPYAFSLFGADASGFLAAVGSFTTDGHGKITGGLEDENTRAGVSSNLAFTGIYFVFDNGIGFVVLTFTDHSMAVWEITMVNDQHVVFSNFDGTGLVGVGRVVTGSIDRQDVSAFNTGALKGNYVANFSGVDPATGVLKQVGAFTADGAGAITNGVLDVNNGGVPATNQPLSNATYMISSTGRGTLSFAAAGTTQTFALYAVTSTQYKIVETDTGSAVVGELNQQEAGPFSNASLSGGYAFTMDGTSANGAFALGGVFTADGAGSLASGVFDENDGGVVTTAFSSTSGSYAVAPNGRGTATLVLNDNTGRTLNFVLYPEANGSVAILDIDANSILASGAAFSQTGSLTQSNLDGTFALNWNGTLFATAPHSLEFISGVLIGSGGNLGGTLRIGTLNSVGVGGNQTATVSGPFTVAANGRGTASLVQSVILTPFTQAVYVVDNNTTLTLDVDSRRALTGVLKRQF